MRTNNNYFQLVDILLQAIPDAELAMQAQDLFLSDESDSEVEEEAETAASTKAQHYTTNVPSPKEIVRASLALLSLKRPRPSSSTTAEVRQKSGQKKHISALEMPAADPILVKIMLLRFFFSAFGIHIQNPEIYLRTQDAHNLMVPAECVKYRISAAEFKFYYLILFELNNHLDMQRLFLHFATSGTLFLGMYGTIIATVKALDIPASNRTITTLLTWHKEAIEMNQATIWELAQAMSSPWFRIILKSLSGYQPAGIEPKIMHLLDTIDQYGADCAPQIYRILENEPDVTLSISRKLSTIGVENQNINIKKIFPDIIANLDEVASNPKKLSDSVTRLADAIVRRLGKSDETVHFFDFLFETAVYVIDEDLYDNVTQIAEDLASWKNNKTYFPFPTKAIADFIHQVCTGRDLDKIIYLLKLKPLGEFALRSPSCHMERKAQAVEKLDLEQQNSSASLQPEARKAVVKLVALAEGNSKDNPRHLLKIFLGGLMPTAEELAFKSSRTTTSAGHRAVLQPRQGEGSTFNNSRNTGNSPRY